MSVLNFTRYRKNLADASTVTTKGRVTELIGLVARAVVPGVKIGELCYLNPGKGRPPIRSEVVGFQGHEVLLMPLGELEGIAPGTEVVPTGNCLTVKVGPELLGRVLNGLGDPMDEEERGALECDESYPVHQDPPDPLKRERVKEPIATGIKALDGILTVGEGQRVGIFSAAGVGKSTLMGMIARNSEADVNVIGLVGERGREVRDFIERDLRDEGLARSIVVVSTSDQPSLVRAKAAYVTTAIAEYFRDQGKRVFLMMDSVTRFARALREIGLAVGEPPARQGFTPSVFSTLPRLLLLFQLFQLLQEVDPMAPILYLRPARGHFSMKLKAGLPALLDNLLLLFFQLLQLFLLTLQLGDCPGQLTLGPLLGARLDRQEGLQPVNGGDLYHDPKTPVSWSSASSKSIDSSTPCFKKAFASSIFSMA